MKIAIPFLLISLISFQIQASNKKIPESKIEQFIELSGIEEMIESMPELIDASTNQRLLTSKNPEREGEIIQWLVDSWDSSEITNSIINNIQVNSNDAEITQLLKWKEDPLMLKITEAETEALSPQFQNNLLRYIADIQATPPTAGTTQAVHRFVDSTDMANMMAEMSIQVTKSMMEAFMLAESEKDSAVPFDLNNEINSMRAMLIPQMEQQAIFTSYYIYRNISDDELNSYSSFYESELGKRELALVSESLNVAMSLWAQKVGIAISNSMVQMN